MSFYSLPSTIINSTKYPILNAAYTFYYATDAAFPPESSSTQGSSSSTAIVAGNDRREQLATRLKALMGDLLTEVKNVRPFLSHASQNMNSKADGIVSCLLGRL